MLKPTFTYSSQTWTIIEKQEENGIIQIKIYGGVKLDGRLRKRINKERETLLLK